MLLALSYLFHKGKRSVDEKPYSVLVQESKENYSLFYYETPVLAYLIHVHRCVLLLISVFIILNIVFVKLSRFYLKSTETH